MRDPRGGRRRGPSHQRGGLSPGSGLCPGGGDLPEAGTVHHGQGFRGRGGNLPGPADAADPEGADHGCGKGDPPAGAEGAGPGRGCGDLRDPRRGQRRDRDPGDGEGPAGGLTLPRVRGSRTGQGSGGPLPRGEVGAAEDPPEGTLQLPCGARARFGEPAGYQGGARQAPREGAQKRGHDRRGPGKNRRFNKKTDRDCQQKKAWQSLSACGDI